MSVVIYILALAGYTYLGFVLMALGVITRMDAPTTWPSYLWLAIFVLLWVTGLWAGTVAYF